MLTSEADVLRTLQAGTYTLERLYGLCEQRAPVGKMPVGRGARDRERCRELAQRKRLIADSFDFHRRRGR